MTDSVSKNTSYLVLGEAPGSTSYPQGKYQKALELGPALSRRVELVEAAVEGVKVIGEEELKTLAGEGV